ncbi:helix-turn-helix domain-containing protein [Salisediminibacterium selenitireducens]|uniref:Transcriptional regulator, XRE family n=1 Tax=Bacillus selenitireducens (strain ATCC 700615 / DSM 15326 / MLS10) TaxID=439292 RepID=D6XZ81_BACIE|nr:helix-turn-helix transcriptional regulator [Salisediminibacterium selenitireducens]ADI00366.1 putative transcriptional regulator, XRE family [[Bacillus] selenitireducens MLS10]
MTEEFPERDEMIYGESVPLGQKIHERRVSLRLSLGETAEATGLKEADLRQIEGGDFTPGDARVKALIDALNVKTEE